MATYKFYLNELTYEVIESARHLKDHRFLAEKEFDTLFAADDFRFLLETTVKATLSTVGSKLLNMGR